MKINVSLQEPLEEAHSRDLGQTIHLKRKKCFPRYSGTYLYSQHSLGKDRAL